MPPTPPSVDVGVQTLTELAAVKAQLAAISQLITQGHAATNQRIDDLRTAITGRVDGIETRVKTLEANERQTAVRAASLGAFGGAVVAAALEVIRRQH